MLLCTWSPSSLCWNMTLPTSWVWGVHKWCHLILCKTDPSPSFTLDCHKSWTPPTKMTSQAYNLSLQKRQWLLPAETCLDFTFLIPTSALNVSNTACICCWVSCCGQCSSTLVVYAQPQTRCTLGLHSHDGTDGRAIMSQTLLHIGLLCEQCH